MLSSDNASETKPADVRQPHVILPTAIYTLAAFRSIFQARTSSVRREVREGRLRVCKRLGRYFIIGEDVLAWLRAGEHKPKRRRSKGKRRPPVKVEANGAANGVHVENGKGS